MRYNLAYISEVEESYQQKIMLRGINYWILLTVRHLDETWIVPNEESRTYEVEPNSDLKKGDIIYYPGCMA